MSGPVRSNLLKQRLDRFTRAISGVEKGDIRSLHRIRIASRRLREVVPILQLEAPVTKKLARKLRRVTRRLGSIRELDVLLLLIDELHASRPSHRDALRRLGVAVKKGRDAERRRIGERLPADDLSRMARRLGRIVDELRESETARPERRRPSRATSVAWAIDARTAHRAAALNSAVADAGTVYLPERLHAVRVAVKKLRYALELSSDTGDKTASALRILKRVQMLLGRMHDVQVLIERAREVQASLAPATNLSVWRELGSLVVALDEICRRLHARYVHERGAIDSIVARLAAPPAAPSTNARSERRAG
jgi:CHAD domain-containing protein